ncbi:MAG TPA: PCRF domain-containing protein, partial [Marinagarivorans sp.]|nr:PCRF domain-containing protein [Marinagarivorans sp.]
MKASILEKLDSLSERYEEVGVLLGDADIISNQPKFRELSKEYAELEPVVLAYRDYRKMLNNLAEAKEMLADPEMRAMAQEEINATEALLPALEIDLQKLLLPKDPRDGK